MDFGAILCVNFWVILRAVFGTIFGQYFGTNYFNMDAIDLDTFNGVDTVLIQQIL